MSDKLSDFAVLTDDFLTVKPEGHQGALDLGRRTRGLSHPGLRLALAYNAFV